MEKLKVKNFGAIGAGLEENDGFIEIGKMNLFLGEQGSGKSTITKLLSTFFWLEKALLRGDFSDEELTYEVFVTKYLAWQTIETYIHDNSELEFIGTKYRFSLKDRTFSVYKMNESAAYRRPKIAYISSERNLCSSIPRADKISGLLHNLALTVEDFQDASEHIGSVNLPIGTFSYRYDKNTKRKFISNKNDWEIQLYEAASGIQSLTPLFLITEYYSNPSLQFSNAKISALSSEQKSLIRDSFESCRQKNNVSLESFSDFTALVLKSAGIMNIEETAKNIETQQFIEFEDLISGIVNSCFVNIVEEPEQNLYPNSQKALMEFLVKSTQRPGNRLVFTTHSPYILGTVNNCLYAGNLMKKGLDVSSIVDSEHCLTSADVRAYFIEDGKITSAFDSELGQINHDLIDGCSRDINEVYEKLSDVEFSK